MKKSDYTSMNKFMRQISSTKNQKSCTQILIQIRITDTIKKQFGNLSKNNGKYQQVTHEPEKDEDTRKTQIQMLY